MALKLKMLSIDDDDDVYAEELQDALTGGRDGRLAARDNRLALRHVKKHSAEDGHFSRVDKRELALEPRGVILKRLY